MPWPFGSSVRQRRCRGQLLFLTMLALAVGTGARLGAEPADYLIDVWDTENDLPNSSVTALAQTRDGYLWVGTYNGLARFDGVKFVTYDPVNTPALGHARIRDLFLDGGGTLWINTYRGGLTSYRDGVFRREWDGPGEFDLHTTLEYWSSNSVVFVTQFGEVLESRPDRTGTKRDWSTVSPPGGARLVFQCAEKDGTLWFLTRDGHILRMAPGREFKDLAKECSPVAGRTHTLATDATGRVWAGTDRGVARWDGLQFQDVTPTNGEPTLEALLVKPTRDGGAWVLANGRLRKLKGRCWVAEATEWQGLLGWASGRAMGMHEDREGGVWFNHYGNGVFHVTPDGQFQRFTARDGLPGDRVWAWFQGVEGDIWLGVDRGGLARLRRRRFQVIGPAAGLPARAAFSVCEDEQGVMWFGTSGGGLCRWSGGKIETMPVGNDASANFVFSVFPRPGQGLWLSGAAGEDLFVYHDGQIQRGPWEGVHGVKSLLVDQGGRVWMGTKAGLNWWLPERRRSFTTRDGMTATAVRALAEGKDAVWCGNDEGTLYRCEPERIEAFRPADELAGQPIWSLCADRDGAIWAGTFRGGLLRFRDGRFARVTSEQGLPSDVISALLEDGQGRLWLGTHQGICRIVKSVLNDCCDGKKRRVDCVTYGRAEGLPTLECTSNYQPACWRARDGRLWFATVKGMVSVKPNELVSNPVPPPVTVEEMLVDGERMRLAVGRVQVPPGRKQFEFRFAGPGELRFRYQLEGLDNDWVEAGTRREAHYSFLPARAYTFRVLGCNNDGVWNETGSTVAFVVQQHFFQTWWFRVLAAGLLLGAVAASVRAVTTRKYRRALSQLEQQHAIERDRARIAKDIHDDLGAGLTQITLLSELAKRDPAEQPAHLERISDSARRLTRAMDEIVWAVDPQHDTLSGLMDYISAYTEDYLRTAGIRCRMDLPGELPAFRVEAELRYNLFLALKEALNNIVKHAEATEAWLRLRLDGLAFTLVIEDNGKGMSAAGKATGAWRLNSGHGLSNLEKRLATVGGRCTVRSEPGQGTRVEMTVHPQLPSPIVAIGSAHGDEPSLGSE